MIFRTRRFVIALAPLLLLAAGACDGPRSASPRLVIGSDLANPPFASVNAQDEPVGRDVEMARELARRTGRELEWRRMPFDMLLDAVERGAIDAVVATLGITPARTERVPFTRPYYVTGIAVLVRAGDGEPQSLADLAGKHISAGRGTTSESAARSELPRAILAEPSDKGDNAFERLFAGDVDAIVLDGPNAAAIVAEHPDRVRRLQPDLAEERYGIPVRPDAPDLLRALDEALRAMEAEGVLDALNRRHGLAQ